MPKGQEPIEWPLLTTYPAQTLASAELVLRGYAQRWRIEEFHRVWKSGTCRVEETQLRDYDAILRWATILTSVAMRIVRMTYLARTRPETPATAEVSQAEIHAIVVTQQPVGYRQDQVPSISRLVAGSQTLGTIPANPPAAPPGAIVIARGLDRIQILADFLTHRGQEKM